MPATPCRFHAEALADPGRASGTDRCKSFAQNSRPLSLDRNDRPGLMRFDGARFTVFDHEELRQKIKENKASFALMTSRDGSLLDRHEAAEWCGYQSGKFPRPMACEKAPELTGLCAHCMKIANGTIGWNG